jgi:hypothetical protein
MLNERHKPLNKGHYMTKAVNYTPEMTKAVVETWTANPSAETLAALAKAHGKTVKSIVAKLVREGVYKAKATEKVKKATKAEVNAEINKWLNTDLDLTALTLDTLKALAEAVEPTETDPEQFVD